MKYNPTRRSEVQNYDRCLCGWDRRRQIWVRNGCRLHHPTTAQLIADNVEVMARADALLALDKDFPGRGK